MSSVLQIELVVDELNIWSSEEFDENSRKLIRFDFLGKSIEVDENEIHGKCLKNNKTLVAELKGIICGEISVIRKSHSSERILGRSEFAQVLANNRIDKRVHFNEHAILTSGVNDDLVGCLNYQIIISKCDLCSELKKEFPCSSMYVNQVDNHPFEKCLQVDPCTTPTNPCNPSLEPTFKEYLAEMNGNSLFVRVSKSSHLVKRIYDNQNDCRKNESKLCQCCQKTKKPRLPLIKPNSKHPGVPNCQECMSKCSVLQPRGIEICQKSNPDPNSDIFILKIGQKLYSNTSNSIELELKTPKLVEAQAPSKETKESQVIEKDFEVEKDAKTDKKETKIESKKADKKGGKKDTKKKK